jgi:hypothetical protein
MALNRRLTSTTSRYGSFAGKASSLLVVSYR